MPKLWNASSDIAKPSVKASLFLLPFHERGSVYEVGAKRREGDHPGVEDAFQQARKPGGHDPSKR